jgi:2-oxoglutarate dehydrogenase E1 component
MSNNNQFGDLNLAYILGLYEDYLIDPESVGEDLVIFFNSEDFKKYKRSSHSQNHSEAPKSRDNIANNNDETLILNQIRKEGHKYAKLDPLNLIAKKEYILNSNGTSEKIKNIYTTTIGYEYFHLDNQEEITWLIDNIENDINPPNFDEQNSLLDRIIEVDTFEEFLSKHFPAKKWFSIQGEDSLIPILDKIIELGNRDSMEHMTIGMQHRGRISVMATLFKLPYSDVFSYLKQGKVNLNKTTDEINPPGWMQDVLYHYGSEISINNLKIKLLDNPSHLELASPVVNGYLKSIQENLMSDQSNSHDKSISVLTHGDSSFAGQGIVSELFNMKDLDLYNVGGTIHVVVNNQIGFTTNPEESKSEGYCTDIAKAYNIPVFHVNADDVESCLKVASIAYNYRKKFKKDIIIDLVGYRKHGHNEGDEPSFTQPLMYKKIKSHPSLKTIYTEKLSSEHGDKINTIADESFEKWNQKLEADLENPNINKSSDISKSIIKNNTNIIIDYEYKGTKLKTNEFKSLNHAIFNIPSNVSINNRLERILKRKQDVLNSNSNLDWAHAELLALASIINNGSNLRLTGQDSERGTFSQRHAVLHDINNGEKYIPLNYILPNQKNIQIKNSPLTEMATLAFEYGYTLNSENNFVLWEAQFGDFVNNAQAVIDEYISSGFSKWGITSSLVMLLPHGYEGQGPNHSSAHLERYLSLCADSNMRVIYPSKSSQYFHALKMQANEKNNITPMIIMTPKSLLRHPFAASPIKEFTETEFSKIIAYLPKNTGGITTLVMCSGKIIVDLLDENKEPINKNNAIISIEELYPFPSKDIEGFLSKNKNINKIIWIQEEPKNRGAWHFVSNQIHNSSIMKEYELEYYGSTERASTSVGTSELHKIQIESIKNKFNEIK